MTDNEKLLGAMLIAVGAAYIWTVTKTIKHLNWVDKQNNAIREGLLEMACMIHKCSNEDKEA